MNVIDLFCGCGGLSYGFEQAGFKTVLGIDCWHVALKTFQKNFPQSKALLADVLELEPEELDKHINGNRIHGIIGGPPCQGFSISGKRDPDDPRNKLYKFFLKSVEYYNPSFFVMENVPNLIAIGKGEIKNEIITNFKALGYKIEYESLLASDFGVPQNRKRVFFVGTKNGIDFSFPQKTHGKSELRPRITSYEAISDLPELETKDGIKYPTPATSDYQILMRKDSKGLWNHETTKHTEKTTSIVAMVPDGGNYKSLPKELWETRKVNIAWTRLNSKKPSFTIDTGHNHHFHYQFNRVPTARESARIQSFPDTFIFLGKKNEQLKQVGNAAPPILARKIAEQLIIK